MVEDQEAMEEETVVEEAVVEETQPDLDLPRLTELALVATMAKNNVVLLYEFKPVEEAREIARKHFDAI